MVGKVVKRNIVNNEIDFKITKSIRELARSIRDVYDGLDGQRRTLIKLSEIGPVTQRELTAILEIRPASMSEVLTKLTNKGFIERTQSEEDKRTAVISLTEEGEARAKKSVELRGERIDEMFSGFNPQEKETLLELLERINTD